MSDDVKTDDAPNRELNDRQKAFCMSYTKDFNGSRAAIEAGYSEDSSRQIASELLTKPNIRAEIERILNESSRAQIPEITGQFSNQEVDNNLGDLHSNEQVISNRKKKPKHVIEPHEGLLS